MSTGRRVPDADRAPLEEQRDFLLRSLDDLEREHDAGDIDETDYVALRDDYTVRAAAVLRSLDTHVALQTEPAGPKRRIVLWTVGIVAFAVLAGVGVALTSGRRDAGSVASGDPAGGASENIARADQLMSEDKLEEAIGAYTKALGSQPSNVRALTYRGWLYFQTDDLTRAWADLDAAVEIDAEFPDAHVFRAIMFTRDSKWPDAYAEYKAIDVASAPPDVVQLLVGSRLQERIVAALVAPKLLVASPPTLAASGFTAEEVRLAADQIAEDGRVLDSLKLLDLVLVSNANDVKALATRGWINGRIGQQLIDSGKSVEGKQQLAIGRDGLDTAVRLDPKYLPARVYRAFVALAQNSPTDADVDLRVYEAAPDKPVDMQLLVGQSALRTTIDEALKKK
ncbi:MAG: tetratricopeptide repeat protein [Acidimicrobiales bacterium]